MASAENDTQLKHAIDYWGRHLIQPNKLPSEKLERLLRGIAYCISARFPVQGDEDCRDLTPSQLASFYRLVGGNYDPLFCDMPPQSLAIIYKSLGCAHSLQPMSPKDGHCAPSLPALKSRGFVKWQTIQLLLGPREHAPFIQNALAELNIVDPVDGKPFLKLLPLELFPSQPNREMVEWHNTVGERLRWEAQEAAEEADNSRPSTAEDDTASINGAAHYIASHRQRFHRDDKYKEEKPKEEKPTLIKQITGAPAKVFSPGNVIGRAARNFIDPNLWNPGRRRSVSERPAPPRDSWPKRDERRESEYGGRDPRKEHYARTGSRPQSSQSPRWSGDRDRGRGGNENGHSSPHVHERPGSNPRREGRRRSISSSSNSPEPPPYRMTRQRSVSHDSPQSRHVYSGVSGHRSSEEQPPRRPHDYERRESFTSSGTRRRHGSNTSVNNGPDFGSPGGGSRGSPQPQWAGPTSAPRMAHPPPHPAPQSQSLPQQQQQQGQRPSPASRNSSYGNDMQRSQSYQQQPPSLASNFGASGAGAGVAAAMDGNASTARRANSMRHSRVSKPLNANSGEAAESTTTMPTTKRKTAEPRWQPRWEDSYRPTDDNIHLDIPRATNDPSLQRRRSAPSPGASPSVSPAAATTPERRSSGFEVRATTPGATTDYFFGSGGGGAAAAEEAGLVDSMLSGDSAGGIQNVPQMRVNGVGGRRYPSGTPWD